MHEFCKIFLPRSLLGRFLLILIIPCILLPVVSTYIFYERHWDSVSKHMIASLVREVALITENYISDQDIEYLGTALDLQASGMNGDITSYKNTENLQAVYDQLVQYLGLPVRVVDSSTDIDIYIQTMDNQILHIATPRKRITNPTTSIFIIGVASTAALLLIISVIFTKNQIRAITKLAKVAENFGKGVRDKDYKPTGAKEVRQAGELFVDMMDRIERQVNQRTEMLAGVSHDLRTPLTRMKLQLTLMGKSEEIQFLEEDIAEMEYMIQSYLDFTRKQDVEASQDVILNEALKQIVSSYANYEQKVIFTGDLTVHKKIRPNSFRRCINNLINNAVRHGDTVNVSLKKKEDGYIDIMIDDNGEGIPLEYRENVFKPFFRVDSSRNSATGGAGLGLSIARDIITAHGGEILLEDSPDGGLRVIARLPE